MPRAGATLRTGLHRWVSGFLVLHLLHFDVQQLLTPLLDG